MTNCTVRVDGTTVLVPLLAFPSVHVRTPAFFNEHCVETGRNAAMMPWQVHPEHLSAAIQAIRRIDSIHGAVVTIPHKTAVGALCDELEGVSALTGVCNVIRKTPDGRLIGALLDGSGFVEGLKRQGHAVEGRSAVLVGAGGAATAVAFALAEHGLKRLGLSNRSFVKAKSLAELLTGRFPDLEVELPPGDWSNFDLAINGTALGMHEGDDLPMDVFRLGSRCCVAEVVMNPDTTNLLALAANRDLTIHKGVHMVQAQIPLLVEMTTRPDPERDERKGSRIGQKAESQEPVQAGNPDCGAPVRCA